MTQTQSTYEGLQEHIRDLATPAIDTWENRYPDRDYTIHMEVPEFTCICPKTARPDFATLTIDYGPNELCIELKSFKEYIVSFRNVGIFHEHVVNRVLDDLVRACMPRWARIEGDFNLRGGIHTIVKAEYHAP